MFMLENPWIKKLVGNVDLSHYQYDLLIQLISLLCMVLHGTLVLGCRPHDALEIIEY